MPTLLCGHEYAQRYPFVGLSGVAAADIISMQVRLKAVEGLNHLLVNTAAAQLTTLTSGLRDSSNAPLLASLFSSVMKASEEEVRKGLTGNKALSAASLRAVGLLGTAVGDGDALAFVLPGLASGLVKVMLAAGIALFPDRRYCVAKDLVSCNRLTAVP